MLACTYLYQFSRSIMLQYLFVKEFGLFSTTFRRVDGQEIIVPNSLLSSTKLVHNMRRSNSMFVTSTLMYFPILTSIRWESTTIMISYGTPLEIIEQLKQRVQAYVVNNGREWSNSGVNIDKMEYQNAIHLTVGVERK